ncbi:MAG: class B sortase, partial [Oscillospiraceae bacterium]|nr:class B sortase [Oscillospiraceae bacterium]
MSGRKFAVLFAIIALIIVLAAAAVIYFVFFDRTDDIKTVEEVTEYFTPPEEQTAPVLPEPEIDADAVTEPEEPYVSPVDFDGLREQNEDIYAWLDIGGTEISYPVACRVGDNDFYMDHNIFAESDGNGALFTEDLNSLDFTDPVTVIYGHRSGVLFNKLPGSYASQELLEQNSEITVFLPDCEYRYKVFAAVRFSNVHILKNYDFSRRFVFDYFINEVMT